MLVSSNFPPQFQSRFNRIPGSWICTQVVLCGKRWPWCCVSIIDIGELFVLHSIGIVVEKRMVRLTLNIRRSRSRCIEDSPSEQIQDILRVTLITTASFRWCVRACRTSGSLPNCRGTQGKLFWTYVDAKDRIALAQGIDTFPPGWARLEIDNLRMLWSWGL